MGIEIFVDKKSYKKSKEHYGETILPELDTTVFWAGGNEPYIKVARGNSRIYIQKILDKRNHTLDVPVEVDVNRFCDLFKNVPAKIMYTSQLEVRRIK